MPTDKFSNSQVKVMNKFELDLWDVSGKLPHLWGHHFTGGVQGIIFVVENQSFQQRPDDPIKQLEIEKYYKDVQ